MKKILTITIIALLTFSIFSTECEARLRTKKITINTDPDVKLYVNGKLVGTGTTVIKVEPSSSVNVRAERVGFITQERNYINDVSHDLPSTDYMKMEKDDAYENSFVTNLANQDIDIRTSHSEDDAWKLISRIITNSFDVIQVTDKTTGYMCTAWVVKNFKAATIRTRLIIKTGSSDPLTYKAKLVSEIAPAGTSANADESFRQWDRLLRSFENVVSELQSRLGK
ncbi:MAG: hypothetical protein JST52_04915 [Bacteroidetes bacterium]|nr:hypothetical protein [Bacteroidota bacterium]MBS1740856.1 hypothetical protein [Bacteroidota bacterium]MBS1777088.1 hypothetical protein [Bacteroidota bacterium]